MFCRQKFLSFDCCKPISYISHLLKKKQIYLAKNNTEVKVIFLDKFYYFILQHKFSVKGKGNGSNEKAERSNVDEGKLQQQH